MADLTKQLAEALRDAVRSLETIGRLAGKPYYGRDEQGEPIPTYMGHNDEVRSYANNRAGVALAAFNAFNAQQAAPGEQPAQGEREAFEAWIAEDCGDLSMFGHGQHRHYRNSAVNQSWVAWQARAALASQPAARVALTDEQIKIGRWATSADPDDWPESWSFEQGVRFAERAHGITAPAAGEKPHA